PHSPFVQCTLPFGDHDGGDAIANQIGEGARFRHETIDAQDEGDTRYRNRAYRRECSGKHNEAAAGDAGRPLRGQQQDADNAELLPQGQLGVGGLGEEDRRHGEIDAGSVEVERVAGGNDQADDRSLLPRVSILAIIRGRTDSDEEVPRTISSSSLMYLMNLRMLKP